MSGPASGPSGYLVFARREANGVWMPVVLGYHATMGRDATHRAPREVAPCLGKDVVS